VCVCVGEYDSSKRTAEMQARRQPGGKRTSDSRGGPCHARTLAPATNHQNTHLPAVVFGNYIITHRVGA